METIREILEQHILDYGEEYRLATTFDELELDLLRYMEQLRKELLHDKKIS